MDPSFSVLVDGWTESDGRPVSSAPKLNGRVLTCGKETSLLPESLHQLLGEIVQLQTARMEVRTQAFKERSFGRLRKLALASGCPVSDYLRSTIVLTPEHLRLTMDRRSTGDTHLVEVVPEFDEAPVGWLTQFDRFPVRDSYDVAVGPSLVRILVSAEVKTVLAEIKRMPGRRVSGARAEAFVRNPYALLGDEAHHVIDADQFDQARTNAGIVFYRFSPSAEYGVQGEIVRVGLQVEAVGSVEQSSVYWFADSKELDAFVSKLGRCLEDGSQCVQWRMHELELLGDTSDHLQLLQSWSRAWSHPALWTASEVFDLGNYSERIEGIGVERPFVTPVIARDNESGGWFVDNVTVGLRVDDRTKNTSELVPFKLAEIPSLQAAVAAAEALAATEVFLPGLQTGVPIAEAKVAVALLLRAQEQLEKQVFQPPQNGKGGKSARRRLIIKRNLEEIDYSETRSDWLEMPEGQAPKLPLGLKVDTILKPYQIVGVAWLQHLWGASPEHCRGTVLADDMGLGKTLQLLTFISSCFDADPTLPPALVVAPVALLENWRNELTRFFKPETLPLLILYGDALKALRASKHDVDEELKQQGITRLLKKNWVGNARLVLTTYETMRDLEFAMASQPWSVMVCDEAQKIKNPSAMVTRSAKKQKVRFRIACTGTPVENTLADLWCLFDFVQPGMLGALNHFSRTYRQPIEAKTEEQQARVAELRKVIEPQILHRKKTEVARDLPVPIVDAACKKLPMSTFQQRLYEGAMNELREQRETNPTAQLAALMAVRKICSDPHGFAVADPRIVPIEKLVSESPKMGWLVKTLISLVADSAGGHKVIVFCEFRELQLMLQRVIAAHFGIAPSIVNGDTSADPKASENRQQLIDAFQVRPGFNVIILSPLAVGFGVNIQAANHVIHFTRTWNPAKEDQATARAYRIGQKRVVTVYYPGVIDEKFSSFDVRLDELLEKKRALAGDILNGCSDVKVSDFTDFV